MDADPAALPDDIAPLRAALLFAQARADEAEAEAALARARQSDAEALVAHQQLQIEKLRREIYGPRSERTQLLLDQMELQLEELEASATEDEIQAEKDTAKTTTVASFSRKRPARITVPRAPAARACGRAGTVGVHLLRWRALVQAGGGCHRD